MKCSRGAVSPMVALMLVPILGTTALAVDAGYWYYVQRSMQNAADSAAIAAASTGDDDYVQLAKGTTASYGFVDGENNITVGASRVTCPSGTGTCTQVAISYISPLFFSPIVQFTGDSNGGTGQGVAALAVAGDSNGGASHEFCIVALSSTPGDGILANGVPHANLNGCDIFSNSAIQCTGHNLNAGSAIAVGTSDVCGVEQIEGAEPLEDPYEDRGDNIPADPCGGTPANYPQAFASGNTSDTLSPTNKIAGSYGWAGNKIFCGDVVLTGDVNISNVTLVIMNGRLITNSHKLTANSSTLVFSGDNNPLYHHYPTDHVNSNKNVGGSTIEVAAPTSGDWSGVAIYQDPSLTTNVDVQESGNTPAYNLSGLFYAPNADVAFWGVVNKAGTGYNCFVLVAGTVDIRGTGQIYANATDQCDDAGLDVPTDGTGAGGPKWLVK
ncbi:hypothetical protein GCM10011494_00500 [Novosphingobium endophyticum]|uniref:Putative Flp pilus-assembly TadG-like N-terminal domain-containing protein n=1 Tax=Novosphingobium endophyticum TaxID=1955250 RepID=A0A916TNV6_9SPHN|nr:hypothetical protein GCM10011494_00500 [Novosphingobium endophyticum]